MYLPTKIPLPIHPSLETTLHENSSKEHEKKKS